MMEDAPFLIAVGQLIRTSTQSGLTLPILRLFTWARTAEFTSLQTTPTHGHSYARCLSRSSITHRSTWSTHTMFMAGWRTTVRGWGPLTAPTGENCATGAP